MSDRGLVIYIPVLHQGYLEFLHSHAPNIESVYLIDTHFVSNLSQFEPDIAAINTDIVMKLLSDVGLKEPVIVNQNNIKELKGKKLLLIDDEVSRTLANNLLQGDDIEWVSVFLRWDSESVISTHSIEANLAEDRTSMGFMKEAYSEAEKSSDWWRQVGAVLVKQEKIVLRGYNKGMPSDHVPYQSGAVRDFIEVGKHPELSSTIHAEQLIVAQAAKKGISLEGTDFYVTHFPCSVCAKIVVSSGIKRCYFSEGSANLDGKKLLEQAGVKVFFVPMTKEQ